MRKQGVYDLLWIALIIVGSLALVRTAPAFELNDTNTTEIQRWFQNLQNHMGGSCCGEGDGYPARIVHMPTPPANDKDIALKQDGEACVIDGAEKEIVVDGTVIKKKRKITGNPCIHFTWNQLTKEKLGNPFDYAFVFVGTNEDGSIASIWCVVPIPMNS